MVRRAFPFFRRQEEREGILLTSSASPPLNLRLLCPRRTIEHHTLLPTYFPRLQMLRQSVDG